MSVAPANSTYAAIEQKVRHLTASPGESSLKSSYIQQVVNDVYVTDFPYGIKLDQMRDVYTFYTKPYVDRYPLDVNYDQGVREPFYVDGLQGYFFKDRDQFFKMWPRWPSPYNQYGQSSSMGGIASITQALPGVVTTVSPHGLTTGNTVYITGVNGMYEVNGVSYTITVINTTSFSIGVDTSGYSAYVSGGTYYLTPVVFNFIVPGPFLSTQVTIGGVDITGNAFAISDDGNGNLQTNVPNPVVSVPPQTLTPPVPGMYNRNTQNPGLLTVTNVGTVNYVTGTILFTLPYPLQVGTTLNVFVSQYQPARPYSMLFWNNEFTIRPVPKLVHKVTIETYLTPVQFMQTTDNPILNQWWKYLSLLATRQILMDRQDMAGVANTEIELKRQEGLVLERQGTEEIGQRNSTIFASQVPNLGWNYGSWGQGGY